MHFCLSYLVEWIFYVQFVHIFVEIEEGGLFLGYFKGIIMIEVGVQYWVERLRL